MSKQIRPFLPPSRKTLGQHFLVDLNIVRKIMTLAAICQEETVLEIGPGRGVLTRALCAAARTVIAVEVDPKLVAYLSKTLANWGNLDLRLGDAREFSYDSLPLGTVVVANLPYYLSTPLLFSLLAASERLDRLVLMLQAEVARRLVAQPGSRDYGVLSVLVQASVEPRTAFQVPATCFQPKPGVRSAIVHLTIPKTPPLSIKDRALFVRTVRAAFAHRRKTLMNSLAHQGLPSHLVARALQSAGINGARRAETLTLTEFSSLAEALGRTGVTFPE